jgi:hypothetical protein
MGWRAVLSIIGVAIACLGVFVMSSPKLQSKGFKIVLIGVTCIVIAIFGPFIVMLVKALY